MSRLTEITTSLGSLLGNKHSHPDKSLIEHLVGTAKFMVNLAKQRDIQLDEDLLMGIGLTHDLGKAHPKFQSYLNKKGQGVNHAKPSAWFTYTVLQDFWAAEIVCRHHTNLRNAEEMSEWLSDDESIVTIKREMEQFLPNWPLELTETDYDELEELLFDLHDQYNIDLWHKVRTIYSLLISADRLHALGVEVLKQAPVPAYYEPELKLHGTEIDTWRQHVQNICIEKAIDVTEPGIYSLTLPTGAGKTLTGLRIASEWAKRFGCRSIVYALPFISIVEQTTNVAKLAFGEQCIQEDHSLAYGKVNKDTQEANSPWDKMSALFRYWHEPVVLTTLVHLWDALYNPNANHTMNFHSLSKSVVILDEPQTIAPQLWQGLEDTLALLSERWGTYFLLMTATQPHIKTQAELAPPNLVFPCNRHQYRFIQGKYQIDQVPALLTENIQNLDKSGLVVVNRKKAAIQTYQRLQELELHGPIMLLSSWVTPWRRQIILSQLKEMEEAEVSHYLVATQVVEAGVDLDFGWVFRDLGPFDSIIQVAGRCNRHMFLSEPGQVLVAELSTAKGESLWRRVYDQIPVEATREILRENPNFNESEVSALVDKYYDSLVISPAPILRNLAEGKWADIPPLFKDEKQDQVLVFVEETDKVVSMIKDLEEREWTLETRSEQKRLLQELHQYAIQVPANMVGTCQQFCARIATSSDKPIFRAVFDGRAYLLGKEAVNENGLYQPALGFVPPSDDFDPIF